MKKNFPKMTGDMVRAIVYQAFTRLLVLSTVVLLWDRFINHDAMIPESSGFTVAAVLCGLLAWLAWLRLDGIRVPKFDRNLYYKKKKPMQSYSDISDYTDEEIVSFDELEDDEKDLCLLYANLAAFLILIVISFLV